jgi:hypothetical protein
MHKGGLADLTRSGHDLDEPACFAQAARQYG